MKLVFYICIFSIIHILGGCASTYNLSSHAQDIRRTLDRTKAYEILAKLVQPTENARGVCVVGQLRFAHDKSIGTHGPIIEFYAYYRTDIQTSIQGSVQYGTNRITTTYNEKLGKFQVDTTKLKQIRVLETDGRYGCFEGEPGFIVVLYTKDSYESVINVSTNDIDSIMATLNFLSPGARLTTGFGF